MQKTMSRASNSDAKKVKIMVVHGFPRELIAKRLGITEEQLVETYRHELDAAHPEIKAMVNMHLYRRAIDGHLGAICHWLKTRAGWSERARANADAEVKKPKPEEKSPSRKLLLPCNTKAGCFASGPKEILVGLKAVYADVVAEAQRRGLTLDFKRPDYTHTRLTAIAPLMIRLYGRRDGKES